VNETTQQVLNWKNLGFLRFDAEFTIIEIDQTANAGVAG